ncbi:hypothetical protein AC249_AIPGENE19070 [Exaiptasia diaphana]|nr:hypothetical protein AC249_AIPGENE19070 [Exaiptasia diaphana]
MNLLQVNKLNQTTTVESEVLFGDKKDVKICNANKVATKSEGGTITYTLRPSTKAVPGTYVHAKGYRGDAWFHLIHHDSLDGEAITRFLYKSLGAWDFKLDNVWNRYDWCHYRNWSCEEPNQMIYFVPVITDTKKGCPKAGKAIRLTSDCIVGDWFYGLRLVDPDSGLAYAYEFGDSLIMMEDDLYNTKEFEELTKTDFNINMARFLRRTEA